MLDYVRSSDAYRMGDATWSEGIVGSKKQVRASYGGCAASWRLPSSRMQWKDVGPTGWMSMAQNTMLTLTARWGTALNTRGGAHEVSEVDVCNIFHSA